jgi:hypothetical protein
MFVTGLLIYLLASTSLSLNFILLFAAVVVDLIAWATIHNSVEAWATGTTSDQEFWEEDE